MAINWKFRTFARVSATTSKMMLIPLSNLKTIYTYLLNEGVMVVKKDVRAPKHAEINVPNLQVMKALLSLKSRGYVSEQFSWQHFYYFLTDEGILFLRSYLHLPETVVPLTLAKAAAAAAAASRPERDQRQNRSEERVGGEYRREWRKNSEAPAATAH